jgi:hypothetical protein
MKTVLLVFLFALNAFASDDLPKHRFIFEFDSAAGSIKKMQVDLFEKDKLTIAKAKCLNSSDKIASVSLRCEKSSKQEMTCRRDDNGGSFGLVLEPSPRISIGFFSADAEDAEKDEFVLENKGKSRLNVDGKKATISKKDLF